jgi:hypothetical protein
MRPFRPDKRRNPTLGERRSRRKLFVFPGLPRHTEGVAGGIASRRTGERVCHVAPIERGDRKRSRF